MNLRKDISLFEDAWKAGLGGVAPFALARFASRRAAMSAFDVARLDPAFRAATRLSAPRQPRWPWRLRRTVTPFDWDARLHANPEVALMALHAADGHLREKAVRVAPINDGAALAALLLRCNDWAEPVQRAAFARLSTLLPTLKTASLVPVCLFARDRVAHWQRGGAAAAEMLGQHPEWAPALKSTFMRAQNGPLARSLRQLLRQPDYDWALADFAMNAHSAFVRAVAVETLLTGHARWTEGYDWVWHDKVFNLRRKVARRGSRKVNVTPANRTMVLRKACFDHSAKVRCLAADHFITAGLVNEKDLLRRLLCDNSRSVQTRMAFYQRKWRAGQKSNASTTLRELKT